MSRVLIATLCLVTALVRVSCAETITVPPGPSSNVTDALRQARAGDVIELLPGVFTGTIEVQHVSGAPDIPITIRAARDGEVTIDGGFDPSADPYFSGDNWGNTSGTD